jgi:hypothetical protein
VPWFTVEGEACSEERSWASLGALFVIYATSKKQLQLCAILNSLAVWAIARIPLMRYHTDKGFKLVLDSLVTECTQCKSEIRVRDLPPSGLCPSCQRTPKVSYEVKKAVVLGQRQLSVELATEVREQQWLHNLKEAKRILRLEMFIVAQVFAR